MFESLVSGAGIKPVKYGELGTPMAHLRAFLVSDDAKLLSRATDRGLAELVQDAIRLELRGKPVAKLEPSLEGVNYFREMQKPRVYRIGGLFKLPSNKQP